MRFLGFSQKFGIRLGSLYATRTSAQMPTNAPTNETDTQMDLTRTHISLSLGTQTFRATSPQFQHAILPENT